MLDVIQIEGVRTQFCGGCYHLSGNIWASTIFDAVINPPPHGSKCEHGVVDSNIVKEMSVWQ